MIRGRQTEEMYPHIIEYNATMEDIGQTFTRLIDIARKSLSTHKRKGKDAKFLENYLMNLAYKILNISTILKNNGYPKEGEEGLKKAIVLFGYLKQPMAKASALNNLAVFYEKSNNLASAFECYNKARLLCETLDTSQFIGADLINYAGILHGYASTLYNLNCEKFEAIKYFKKALEIRKCLTADPKYKLAKTYLGLGHIYLDDNNLSAAESCFKSVLSILEKNPSPDPDIKKGAEIALACLYLRQVEPHLFNTNSSAPFSDKTTARHAISEAGISEDFLRIIVQQKNSKDNNAESIVFLKKVLSLLEPYPDVPGLKLNALHAISRRMIESGAHKSAEKYARDSVRISQVSQNKTGLVFSVFMLGTALEKCAQYHEALERYEEADTLKAEVEGEEESYLSIAISAGKGLVFMKLSDYANAAASYESALQFHEKRHGKQSILVAETLINLSSVYQAQDRVREMHSACTRSIEIFEGAGCIKEAAHAVLNQGVMYASTDASNYIKHSKLCISLKF